MKNMLRLCQTLAGRYPSVAEDFRLIYKPYLATHYYYKGEYIYSFINWADCLGQEVSS